MTRRRGGGFPAWMAVAVLAAGPVAGQEIPEEAGPRLRAGPPTALHLELALRRAEALGLDEGQVEALRVLRDETLRLRDEWERQALERRQRIRAEARAVREERRAAMDSVEARVEDLLTEDQLRRMWRLDRRWRRGDRPGARRVGESFGSGELWSGRRGRRDPTPGRREGTPEGPSA